MDIGLYQFAELDERQDCEESLGRFFELSWRQIDPSGFTPGWHIDAIAEHLQAVTDGYIQRLCINIPPRMTKSSLVSVAWPAWTWAQSKRAPLAGPEVQFLAASYGHKLSLDLSVKSRRLLQSRWYQKHWGKRFKLTSDVNTKEKYENDKGGYRIATSVDGALTGIGASCIIVDDPHNVSEAESELVRENTLLWWDESMSTRLNDRKTGAFVIVQQRVHQGDLTGHVTRNNPDDWVWLCLPMEYESDRKCITYVKGEKFFEDPRTEDGELLCPERIDAEQLVSLKRELRSEYAVAGQLQQRPSPRGGGIIQEEWWQPWVNPTYPICEFVIASLDTAYTEKSENDPSALSIWGVFRRDSRPSATEVGRHHRSGIYVDGYSGAPCIVLMYCWQARLAFPDLCQRVIETCTRDKRVLKFAKPEQRFKIDRLLIENKAAGISVAQELHRTLSFNSQFGVELFDPKKYGDKVARCYAVQHLFSEGLIHVPWPVRPDGTESPQAYAWAQEMIDQFSVFPRGTHDDLVDSSTMALRYLRESGMLLRQEEHSMDVASELAYRPHIGALYPC